MVIFKGGKKKKTLKPLSSLQTFPFFDSKSNFCLDRQGLFADISCQLRNLEVFQMQHAHPFPAAGLQHHASSKRILRAARTRGNWAERPRVDMAGSSFGSAVFLNEVFALAASSANSLAESSFISVFEQL